MIKLQNGIDWVLTTWATQFLFFIFISIRLITSFSGEQLRQTAWIYMSIYALTFAISSINSLCLPHKHAREVVGMIMAFGSVFIIPLTFYALGGSIELTSAVSLIYVLLAICMSPLWVVGGILAFALG